jgi:tetratricopeptide (TPR) repeat protein
MGIRSSLALAWSTILLPRGLAGDGSALDKAIDLLDEGLRGLPVSDVANRASALSNRALALATRSERTGSRRDLDEAIAGGRDALRLFPRGHRNLLGATSNLVSALQRRYQEGGDAEDLDAAIDVARQAVASSGGDDRDYHLADLADVLHDRYELARRAQDLNEGIAVLQQAVAATASDTPELATRLGHLSTWFRDRFDLEGEAEDLSRAVEIARRCVSVATPEHRHYPLIHTNAANTLQIWHQRTGDLSAMDEAVAWRRSAVTATPEGDPEGPERLSDLGATLLARYRWTAAEDDLQDAGHAARQAVDCLPAEDLREGTYRSNLSATLLETYRRYNRRQDLFAALDQGERAIACSFPEPLGRLMALSNYASALHERADLIGGIDDVQGAIQILGSMAQEAAQFPDHPGLVANACVARITCFYLTSKDADLNEAIAVGRLALTSAAEDAEERHLIASVLGAALRIRHARYGAADDLIESVACAEMALGALPAGHPWQGRYRTNLGSALISLYLRTAHSHALQHAIAVLPDGATRVPAPRDRAILLTHLGLALFIRAHRHRSSEGGPGSEPIPDSTDQEADVEDLNGAIQALRGPRRRAGGRS